MRQFLVLLMGWWLAGGCSRLVAGQFVPLAIDELTAHAELVVWGKVTDRQCCLDPDGRIYTKIGFDVIETWKGAPAGPHLTIVHGGGTVGHRSARVSGQVEYAIGEEAVAFLVRNSRGEGVTLGLAQGKFSVWLDRASGAKRVKNLFHGVNSDIIQPQSAPATTGEAALTLPVLRQKVQQGRP
jgi:hypothetical protein